MTFERADSGTVASTVQLDTVQQGSRSLRLN